MLIRSRALSSCAPLPDHASPALTATLPNPNDRALTIERRLFCFTGTRAGPIPLSVTRRKGFVWFCWHVVKRLRCQAFPSCAPLAQHASLCIVLTPTLTDPIDRTAPLTSQAPAGSIPPSTVTRPRPRRNSGKDSNGDPHTIHEHMLV